MMERHESGRDVGRYLDGAMSPSETRDFALRLGREPELRLQLEAERIIRGSIEDELDAISLPPSGSRDRLMQMAAATLGHRPHDTTVDDTRPTTSGDVSRDTNPLLTAAAITAIVVLMAGIFYMLPATDDAGPVSLPAERREQESRPQAAPWSPAPVEAPRGHIDSPASAVVIPSRVPRDSGSSSRAPRLDTARSAPPVPQAAQEPSAAMAPSEPDSARVRISLSPAKITRPREP